MVTTVTNLGRSGLSDWVVQRFSAVVLLCYTVFLVAFIALNPGLTYEQWAGLYSHICMRIFSLLVLICVVAHGWIGLWGVLTDYVTTRMMGGVATALRVIILSLYAIVSVVFVVWGIEILWGVK